MDNLTQLCVIVPSLVSHQTSSLGEQPPQHPRLWFGFARYVLSRLMAYVAQSKPFSLSLFLVLFQRHHSHPHNLIIRCGSFTVQVSISSELTVLIFPLSLLWSIADSTSCGHFCPSNNLLIGKSKGRCAGRARDWWWCVKKWEQHKCFCHRVSSPLIRKTFMQILLQIHQSKGWLNF